MDGYEYEAKAIQTLINCAKSIEMLHPDDEIYVRNQLLALLQWESFPLEESSFEDISNVDNTLSNIERLDGKWGKASLPDLVEEIVEHTANRGMISHSNSDKDILSSKIMNLFIKKPSEINELFYEKYKKSPESATKYFYALSKNSNYIKTKAIAKNIHYSVETLYGDINITVNLSKPEKDPKQIALERERKIHHSSYPKCLLCIENEGYEGRVDHPARSTHRMIRLELGKEPWFLQYSPYVYYNEHCIVLSKEHRDMKIDRSTFTRLLDFVEKFPTYFIGSNADLPIVGGSILTHDHYQGGQYEFAMERAVENKAFFQSSFPTIEATTLKWPLSVIRLKGKEKEELTNAADMIYEAWKKYSAIDVDIVAYSGEMRHNTITPIVRKRHGEFEIDLVLRNNRTSKKHPLGIFHPHEDVHHIKKENIGLIEVMGLAVLPARLEEELKEVEKFLLHLPSKVNDYHLNWANQLKEKYQSSVTIDTVEEIIRQEVGVKFMKGLEDAGVFKQTESGQEAFERFIQTL